MSEYYSEYKSDRRPGLTIFLMVVAFLFGLGLGWILFSKGCGPEKPKTPTAATAKTVAPTVATAPPAATAALTATAVTAEPIIEQPEPPVVNPTRTPPTKTPPVTPRNLPPAKTAPKTTGPGLTDEQVRAVVTKRLPGIQNEYSTLLKTNPRLGSGKVKVRFTVSPRGTVTDAEVVEDTIGSAELGNAIVRRVRTWKFPAARAETTVNYPFVFVAGK